MSRSAHRRAGTPEFQHLLKALKNLKDWFLFGAILGVPVTELRKIESQHLKEPERCKLEMLQYWLDNKLVPTWKEVVQALEQTNQLSLAAQIKFDYLLHCQQVITRKKVDLWAYLITKSSYHHHVYAVGATPLATDETKAEIRADVTVVSNLKDLGISFGRTYDSESETPS